MVMQIKLLVLLLLLSAWTYYCTGPHLFFQRFIVQSHCESLHLHSKLRNMPQRQTRETALHIDWAERDAREFSKTGKKHGEELRPLKEQSLRT